MGYQISETSLTSFNVVQCDINFVVLIFANSVFGVYRFHNLIRASGELK